MKTLGFSLLLVLAVALMPFCVSAQSLVVGTNSIPLVFEDTNLPQVNPVPLADVRVGGGTDHSSFATMVATVRI